MSESSDTAPEVKPRLVELKERGIVVGGGRLATAMNDAPRALYARAPLVVLPDIGFVWQDYLSLLERHASQRRVFALDWPGFGSSERAPSQGHLPGDERLALTLAAWMDSLGIGRAVFLSTGVSGMVAIRYAAAHPRRTLGLGLIAPVGFYPGGVTSRLGMRVLRTPLLMRRLDGYVTSLLVGPVVTAEAERVLERHRQLRQAPGYAQSIQTFTALWSSLQTSHQDIIRLAETLRVPTMVLRGALDPLVTDAEARQAAAALSGLGGHGTLSITLPEAGHLPFLQQHERFDQAVAGLLETAEVVALETPEQP
jgi:2-hydroxy-6-oxonona-2,4-dienedioate hydrolase